MTAVDAPPAGTSVAAVAGLVAAAAEASDAWAMTPREDRARALAAVADTLDAHADDLVPVAQAETHLAEGRLRGELLRTTFQLRLFGEVVRDGGYLDVRVDQADPDWPMGAPRPDLRRRLEPVGPVLVFAASNFPFAFSVAGGDTAAGLAAGCAVLLKVHPGHPRLSAATGDLVAEALTGVGAPAGLFTLLYGDDAGRAALLDPHVRAGSFTGSLTAGRTLFDLACSRPEPIPFYAEMGSVNPVFVTRSAAADRAEDIVDGFVGSFTLGAGQFCTKPGVLLVPEDSDLPRRLAVRALPGPALLLNDRLQAGYTATLSELAQHPAVTVLGPEGEPASPSIEGAGDPYGDPPAPTLLQTDVAALLADPEGLLRECFGPTALVVTYGHETDLLAVAEVVPGQLTATIWGTEDDAVAPELIRRLASRAGRLLWNGWPTGVSVTYAQQHGGPYPATTAPWTTSVGTAAITRFLRPVAYQSFPAALLPTDLSGSEVAIAAGGSDSS